MAIIKLGTTVVGIRGTIDGITYSANKAGPHAKGWARGANPRTTNQAIIRNRQSTWSAAWRGLTGAQRAGWNTYAALPAQQKFNSLGVGYYVSGFAWYVSCSVNLVQAGLVPIATAPIIAVPAAPSITNFVFYETASIGNTRVHYAVDANSGLRKGINAWVVNSFGRSVGRSKKPFMTTDIVAPGAQLIFQTQLEAVFGTLVLDQRCFCETWNQTTEGRRSPYVQLNAYASP